MSSERLAQLQQELGEDTIEGLTAEINWHRDILNKTPESDPMYARSVELLKRLEEYLTLLKASV